MNTLFKMLIIFLGLSLLAPFFMILSGYEFGSVSYWRNHGYFLLVLLTFFPRLTLLFSSIPFGGFFWWIGWLFAPRILVAVLATLGYWQTNPFLVTVAWFVAWGGESTEKYFVRRRVVFHKTSHKMGTTNKALKDDDVIDVEAHDC